jgi:HEAT repeat protein
VTLADAAAEADALAQRGDERALAALRTQWDDELEAAVRDSDYRVRAQGYRAIGQFRFRQKLELLRRGLDDESPAVRGAAIISLELLSREHPGAVNAVRSLLHTILSSDPNSAVRRLAAAALRNGSPQRETIVLLAGIAEDERQDAEVRAAARKVAGELTKRSRAR